MFADFLAVIGALIYAERHNAAGVRVVFTTPFYVDENRGSNYWAYFFEPLMLMKPGIAAAARTAAVRAQRNALATKASASEDPDAMAASASLAPLPEEPEGKWAFKMHALGWERRWYVFRNPAARGMWRALAFSLHSSIVLC